MLIGLYPGFYGGFPAGEPPFVVKIKKELTFRVTFAGGFASMVALAMNGFTSRSVLFSLVTSVALSLAPQTGAQEVDGASAGATETARRQQSVRDAMLKVQEARAAYAAGRYSDAVDLYREALAGIVKAPASEKQVNFIKDSLADALVAKGMDYRKVGRTDEAVDFMKEALELSPGHKFAQRELDKTQDPVRTNPALSPQHVGNVAEVNRLLSLAYGYYDLGDYDKALETFQGVVRIDPYNTAARRGMELVQNRRANYLKSAHDSFRAKALTEVDKSWEEPMPVEEAVAELAATESGSVVRQDAETEDRIAQALKEMVLPSIVFEDAPIKDVVEALQGQISRFEAQGMGAGRKINIISNFGDRESDGYKTVMSRLVSLNLNDISVHDLLNVLDKQVGITHYITPLGVELSFSGRDFGPMVERVYTVPPHFFDTQDAGDEDEEDDDFGSASRVMVKRVNPVVALKEMGVSFPEGANARYDASTRTLTVRNTAFNQEEIEELISMPLETDRAVVLNVIAMEVNETDLNELGFEWMFNFHLGPKALFGSGTKEELFSEVAAVPAVDASIGAPDTVYSATEGLRSGRDVLSSDNMETLISSGKAGLYGERTKAPGIFSFRGIWNSGDVTMIMRGAAQKKGTDIMTNPRIIMSPGRDEQVVFANVKEMFYPETYTEPQIATTSFNMPRSGGFGNNNNNNNNRNETVTVQAVTASPAHPEAFVRFGMTEDAVGGVGSVVQVHNASVAPDGQHVTLALTVTINEFEGFVNWGTPIYTHLMRENDTHSTQIILSENQILKPVFKRRMENTKLTVGSGAVVVIGGLKESRSVRYEDKLPVLGDLPMVGRLFRSEGEEKIRKAFLMFVKVDVVDPTGRNVGTGERPSDLTD